MNVYRIFCKNMIGNSKKTVRFKLAVFLLTMMVNVLIITFFSYIETSKDKLFRLYGEWNYVIPDYNEEEYMYGGISSNIAVITMRNGQDEYIEIGPISSLDEKAENLFHLQLLSGRMPLNDNEIVVEATTLSLLGINYKLGETIHLPVNGEEMMSYKLVGIINPYRYRWCLSDKSILPTAIVKKEITSKGNALWLSEYEYRQHKNDIVGLGYENTFAYEQTLLFHQMNWLYIALFISMLLVLYILIYFICKNSFKFIKIELDILDKLGISLHDKKKIRKWIIYYLCGKSIPLGLMISIIVFNILSLVTNVIFIKIPYIICGIVTLFIIFILFIAFPLKKVKYKKRMQKMVLKKHWFLFCNNKFNVLSYFIRKIQIFKVHYVFLIGLSCIYALITTFCIFSYVKTIEKSNIELKQETEFDYIISFHNYYLHDDNPYGVSSIDIDNLKSIETIEDVFTIKMNDANYTYENQNNSKSWIKYMDLLAYHAQDFGPKERQNPIILGFSESNKIKSLFKPYTTEGLWKDNFGIITNLYSKIEYLNDEANTTILSTQEEDGVGFYKDSYLKANDKLKFSNDMMITISSVLDKYSFFEKLKIPNEPYTVSVGEQTFQKIFPNHTSVQFIYIKMNNQSNFTTDQQIMNIFSKYDNISIINSRLHKEIIKDNLHIQLLLIAMVEVIVTISWILFYVRISSLKEILSKKMKQVLLALGIEQKFFIWTALIEALLIAIFMCIGALISYHYFLKHMTFETIWYEVVETHHIVEYMNRYNIIVIEAILCIICCIFILEFSMQRVRSK